MTTAEVQTINIPIVAGGATQPFEVPPELTIMEYAPKVEAPEGYGVFRIINHSGDDRLCWDKRDFAQIKAARQTFQDLVHQGLKPFRVDPLGRATPEPMTEFDATAEEVIFQPMQPVMGG